MKQSKQKPQGGKAVPKGGKGGKHVPGMPPQDMNPDMGKQ